MPTQTLSRQALYDAVWAKPISLLCQELGVSGPGLKKICTRYHIPTPERGYWAKLAHGKRVKRWLLPNTDGADAVMIRFEGRPHSALPAPVRDAKADVLAKIAAVADAGGPPPADEFAPAARSAHPIVARLAKALARAKPDASGFISTKADNLPALVCGIDSSERVVVLVERLIVGVEALGWTAQPSPAGLRIVVDGEPIAFTLAEKVARVAHKPTTRELREKELAEARGRAWAPWPDTDPSPSGVLMLEICENRYGPLTRRYGDLKQRPLDARLDEILASVAAHAALNIEQRRKAEEQRKIREAEERERQLEAAFKAREKRRMAMIDAIHDELEARAKLAAVAAHLAQVGHDGRPTLDEMAAWIAFRIKEIDARLAPQFLDISVRHSEVNFAERRGEEDQGASNRYRYYSHEPQLWLWSLDEEASRATSVSTWRWASDAAVLPVANNTKDEE